MARIPATLLAGVAVGWFLAVAAPCPDAIADPTTPPKPTPSTQRTDGDGSSAAASTPITAPQPQPTEAQPAQTQSAETQSASSKVDAARVLENSASVLRAFPSLTPETPAALLEGTAAVLAAMGFAG